MKLAWVNSDQKLHLSRASRVFVWGLAFCNAAVLGFLILGTIRNSAFDVQSVCEVLFYLMIAIGPVLVAIGQPVGCFVYLALCPIVLAYSAITVPFGIGLLFLAIWTGKGGTMFLVIIAAGVTFVMNIAGVIVIYNVGRPQRQRLIKRNHCPECGNNLRTQPRHARRCLECGFALRPAVGAAPPTEPTETWI